MITFVFYPCKGYEYCDADGLRRGVAADLDDAVRLTREWLMDLVRQSASSRRSESAHARVWDEESDESDEDAEVQVAVVLDPPEPPCTAAEHVWIGDLTGYGRSRCAACGLGRERFNVSCTGDCALDFDEIEYVPE